MTKIGTMKKYHVRYEVTRIEEYEIFAENKEAAINIGFDNGEFIDTIETLRVEPHWKNQVCAKEVPTYIRSPMTGLDIWAPYLINGDASGLDVDEKAMADNWLKRNNIEFVEGCTEPYFTWNMVLYVPDCTKSAGMVVDYACKLKAE